MTASHCPRLHREVRSLSPWEGQLEFHPECVSGHPWRLPEDLRVLCSVPPGPVQFTTLFHFALICASCSDALNAPIGHLRCNSLRVLSLPLRSFGGSSLLSLLRLILGRVLSLLALSILVETLSLVSAWNIFLRKAFDHLGHWLFRNSAAYREKYAWHRDCQCGQMWVYMGSVLISLLKCVN